jgi:NADPH:quinone reductase-like Zn-dependent oxidoreductase
VLRLVGDGAVTAQIAREFPFVQAGAALRYAESGGLTGKVLLVP